MRARSFGFLWLALATVVHGQDTLPQAVRTAQEALRIATRETASDRAYDLSVAFRKADLLDSAKSSGERALRTAVDDRQRARAHFALGRLFFLQQELIAAQESARQAMLLAKAFGDTAIWIRAEGLLCEVDMKQDRFDVARVHAREAHRLALATGDSAALVVTYSQLGGLHYLAQQFDSTRWYYDRCIAYIGPAEADRRLLMRMNQVNLFVEEGRYDSAMARSDALRDVIAAADPGMRSKHHNVRGYALFNAGRYKAAIHEYALSDSFNRAADNDLGRTIENMGFLAESHAAVGDSGKGYQLLLRLEALKDSFAAMAADERMLTLEKQFETKLSQEEIARLDAENKEKAERLRVRNVQLYGSLALALLAIGGFVLVWRNFRQKRKHAAVLEQLNGELAEQQARIQEINGLLRLKVLRTQMDPHFIHNCLNAIRGLSLKGEHEKAEEYLEGFARLLRSVLEHSVRDRISLDEEIAFLNDYVKLEQLRLGEDFTWNITVEEALRDEEPQVPSLLVQPFVENAIWHGLAPKHGPKRLEVHFSTSGGVVTCRVQDNGVGRTEKAPSPGRTSLGLKLTGERLDLLTERMRSAGGFRVEDVKDASGAPAGTRVEMRLAV